jgi:hypothetical protein
VIWLKMLGAVMVLLPFGVLFAGLAQSDGIRFAIKIFLVAFGICGCLMLGTWLVVRQ